MPLSFARMAIVLGLLAAVGPFAIDMYLPSLPTISADLGASTAATQLTLTVFFVAFGICQLVYGPVSDMVGRKPPLYFGLATPEQAKAVVGNLKGFEQPGGLPMSTEETGAQWDLPYGWGNIEMIAIDGLRRYGYNTDADRISYNFLSMVAENFRRDGNIREKYNVVTRSSEAHVELGYQMNVVGFGWTNAAFLELLHGLPKEMVERLEKEQEKPLPDAK